MTPTAKLIVLLTAASIALATMPDAAAAEEPEPPPPDLDLLRAHTAPRSVISTPPLDDVIAQTRAELEAEAARIAARAAELAEAARAQAEAEAAALAETVRAAAIASEPRSSQAPSQPAAGGTTAQLERSGDVWWQLALCESGGNAGINTGNGYTGAFQFLDSTWRSLGYSGSAYQHPYETQLAAAQALQARSGWGQWPACARRLGLL